eukprot:TRINITY_DN1410_c0_g1_i2.p1 TRINITY_DN1410_c0_g1~~TRINITY_DN1410_c0_g1_i2.p1  ORF type:complete len:372 (-),score=130.80 TRINITY_DN1410_c0_g1_i2:173-1288(-)
MWAEAERGMQMVEEGFFQVPPVDWSVSMQMVEEGFFQVPPVDWSVSMQMVEEGFFQVPPVDWSVSMQMVEEGFFQVPPVDWSVSMRDLALGVVQLVQHGYTPSYIVVFDELWQLVHQLSDLVKAVTGNACIMDFFAWHISPHTTTDAGWGPHRDRPNSNPLTSFRPDGTPLYNTVWVPFTNATPDNSCLYVVPAPFDPGYATNDLYNGSQPLERIFHGNPDAYQDIRALPAAAGSVISFTHRLLHWGSRASPYSLDEPRIAMAFAAADDSFEPPQFDRSYLPMPPLAMRVALVSAQSILHAHQEPLRIKHERFLYKTFQAQSRRFNPAYAKKVDLMHQHLEANELANPSEQPEGSSVEEDSDDSSVLDVLS